MRWRISLFTAVTTLSLPDPVRAYAARAPSPGRAPAVPAGAD